MKIGNHESEQDLINEMKATTHSHDEAQGNRDVKGEFKITVRKLKMPVRPRGVLAE